MPNRLTKGNGLFGKVTTEQLEVLEGVTLPEDSIDSDHIAANAITTEKIANDAVTDDKIANDAVGTPQIFNGAVTPEKLSLSYVRTLEIPLTAAANTNAGGVCAVANPEGIPLILISAQLRVETPDDDENLNFGIAANGTTSSTNIFNGAEVVEAGINSVSQLQDTPVLWGLTEVLTGTVGGGGDGSLDGFVGSLHVQYILA